MPNLVHIAAFLTTAVALLAGPAAWAARPDCDYYASPTGDPGASGTSPAEAFTVAAFTTPGAGGAIPAQPGATLCLLDGTYLGADSMIDVLDLHGLPGQPISFVAYNDGGAVIDGEEVRVPARIVESSWLVLEGMDVTRGACPALGVKGRSVDPNDPMAPLSPAVENVVIRRVVASSANPGWSDLDRDSVMDSFDNCTETFNPASSQGGGPLEQPNDTDPYDGDDEFGNACDCDFNNDGSCTNQDALLLTNDFCFYHPGYDENGIVCGLNHQLTGRITDMDSDGDVDLDDSALYGLAAADGLPGPANSDSLANCHVLSINGADDLLLEDVAAFGTGRKTIEFHRSNRVTLRRAWARWEGSGGSNNQIVSCAYDSYGNRCENVLATHNSSQQPPGPHPGVGRAFIGVDHWETANAAFSPTPDPFYVDLEVVGGLAYVKDPLVCGNGVGAVPCVSNGLYFTGGKAATFRDSVVYTNYVEAPVPVGEPGPRRYILSNFCETPTNGCVRVEGEDLELSISNVTTWGPWLKSPGSDWVFDPAQNQSNDEVLPDPPFESVFSVDPVTGTGGQLCYRVNEPGVPLWPWPMRARILAATAAELPRTVPATLAAPWQPEPVDVHVDVEQMFGPIPAPCWNASATVPGMGAVGLLASAGLVLGYGGLVLWRRGRRMRTIRR